MKILHLIPYMHPSAGGPPVVVDRWCVELIRKGIDAGVVTTDAYSDGKPNDWIEQYRSRYPIEVCKKVGPAGFGFSRALKSTFLDKLATTDLVHVHNIWGYTNLLAAGICPKLSVPFVVSTHGMLDPNSFGRKKIKKAIYGKVMEWPALRKAQAIFVTHSEEDRLARETCSDLPEAQVVSLGTEDPPSISREKLKFDFHSKFPLCKNQRLVLFLGRIHPKKGIDLLVRAMLTVRARHPETTLVLAGPGEPEYLKAVRRQCRESGIGSGVVFTGMLEGNDKWAALAAADVFALPSYQENFAIALVEALRMGVPAVVSQRINIWKDLIDGNAAVECELTSSSVAEKINFLLYENDKAARIGENAAKLAAAKYTWKQSGEALIAAYDRVLTNRR